MERCKEPEAFGSCSESSEMGRTTEESVCSFRLFFDEVVLWRSFSNTLGEPGCPPSCSRAACLGGAPAAIERKRETNGEQ